MAKSKWTAKNKSSAAIALLTLLIAYSPTRSHAVEEQPRNYRGIRSAGMGGLITTTGNYGEALFGNPARLSEVDDSKLTLLEVLAEINSNLMSDSAALGNLRAASGPDTIANASQIIGRNEHARLQLMTAYYNPTFIGNLGFGFGLLLSTHANLGVDYTTTIDNQIIADMGPNFGFSYPFLDHALTIGLNLHLLYRVASDGMIDSLHFLTGSKLTLQNFGRQGIGVDADLGAYYHIPWEIPFMRIAVGASINGLLKSHYNMPFQLLSNVQGAPVNNDRVLNYGFRFDFPDWGWFTAPIFSIEMQDNGDTQKRMSFAKRTHLGTEAKLGRVFSLRLGLNQGYGTIGLGIDLPVVKLDLATYGEELAGNAGQREDRRFLFRLAFEL